MTDQRLQRTVAVVPGRLYVFRASRWHGFMGSRLDVVYGGQTVLDDLKGLDVVFGGNSPGVNLSQ